MTDRTSDLVAISYAAKNFPEHPGASEFGGYPGPTRFPDLGPGPDRSADPPGLPRYRAAYAPITEAQSGSDIEVSRAGAGRHVGTTRVVGLPRLNAVDGIAAVRFGLGDRQFR